MAQISLSPTQKTKETKKGFNFTFDKFFWNVFGFVLFIFIITLLLFLYKGYLQNNAKLAEEELANIRKERDIDFERRMVKDFRKLFEVNSLLQDHKTVVPVFSYIESSTHPKVVFQKFELDVSSKTLNLSGITDDTMAFTIQSEVFNRAAEIKNSEITNLNVGQGIVNFNVKLTLDPSLFKTK